MITLGLVDSVDTNGVYVTMPGSRGVLRGPYKALSTVAAGTTVLVASTDDGEQVVVGPAGGGEGFVSVSSFGAKGDGVADDKEAIQSAIDAAGSLPVRFTPGCTYLLGSSLLLPSGTSLTGYGATLKASAGAGHRLITTYDPDNVRVSGLTLDLNRSNVTAPVSEFTTEMTGIQIDATAAGAVGVVVQDVTVINGHQYGIYVSGDSGLPVEIALRNVAVSGCRIGVLIVEGLDVQVVGGDFSDNRQGGIYLHAGSGHRLRGLRACSNGRDGIVFDDAAHDFSVHGCRCDGNGTSDSEGQGITASVETHHFSITGNVCDGNKTAGIQIDPKRVGDSDQIDAYGTVSSNVCTGATDNHGIYVTFARFVTVTGNVCDNNAGAGIMAACSDATIVGNQLVGNNHGVYLAVGTSTPTMGSHVVGPNLYSDNATADLYEDVGVAASRLLDP